MKKRLFVNLLTILTLTLSFVSCGENKDSKEEPSSIETTTSKPTSETTSNQEPTSETTTSEVTTSEAPTSEVVSSETPTIESSSTENELVDVDIVSVKNELRDIAALNQQQDLSKIKQLKISYSEYETYYSNGGEQKEGGHMDGYFDLDKLEGKLDLTMFGQTSKTSCSYSGGNYVLNVNGETKSLNITFEEAKALFVDDIIYKACLFVAFYDFGTGLSSFYERYDLLFNTLDQSYEIPNVDSMRSLGLKTDYNGTYLLTMASDIKDIQDTTTDEKFSLVCDERIELENFLFTSINIVNDRYTKDANNVVKQGKRLEIHGTCSTTL